MTTIRSPLKALYQCQLCWILVPKRHLLFWTDTKKRFDFCFQCGAPISEWKLVPGVLEKRMV
jgi:Pyruvate/2-oxoacid:ferredoxin oxidoreductase delta subunit